MSLRRGTDALVMGDLGAPVVAAEALESLTQLNEKCLDLIAEQSAAQPNSVSLLSRQVCEIWRTLDPLARRRAAECPYLLLDVGFAEPSRWRWLDGQHVNENPNVVVAPYFTVSRAAAVAREVFIYAWHLAQSKYVAAQLCLGMPAYCAQLISACTLSQIHDLAQTHPEWLRPRWIARLRFWRELLLAAASGEVVAIESSRMHGLQLIAAECRKATQQIQSQLG
ncbi:MAG TPA: hypothetical protein VHB68_18530 [Steroidobacteraceae bacterium]|nr:hypothetical protein [Steroidobacteraceae bacterium]